MTPEVACGRLHSLVFVAGLAICVSCADRPLTSSVPTTVRISAGAVGASFNSPMSVALEHVYGTLPGVSVRTVARLGSDPSVEMLERGDAEIAISSADVAYAAFMGRLPDHPAPFQRLRAVALLERQALHLVAGGKSSVRTPQDLKGRAASLGSDRSASVLTATLVLNAHGLDVDRIRRETGARRASLNELAGGELDAMFLLAPYPIEPVSEAVTEGARLLPLAGPPIDRLIREYPFYSYMTIPRGTYPGQSHPVQTIGVSSILLCRADLPDDLVYILTKALFDSLERPTSPLARFRWLDADGASATPIPLHAGAARYYRERELFP
ncbi:MAG: TAXI family TRAP transporter solute-binding subunit [Acidobacteria bacterium]|nr:TAXI family TRAP transporter solute-binding subunit [Acidobacteriota bacterium]